MDSIDPGDDMEMDIGQHLHTGEGLDGELASMRDQSIEPDPDFILEDVQDMQDSPIVQDTNMIAEDGTGQTGEPNDDEMFDEDLIDQIATDVHDNQEYENQFHEDFDETLQSAVEPHFDILSADIHVDESDGDIHTFDFDAITTRDANVENNTLGSYGKAIDTTGGVGTDGQGQQNTSIIHTDQNTTEKDVAEEETVHGVSATPPPALEINDEQLSVNINTKDTTNDEWASASADPAEVDQETHNVHRTRTDDSPLIEHWHEHEEFRDELKHEDEVEREEERNLDGGETEVLQVEGEEEERLQVSKGENEGDHQGGVQSEVPDSHQMEKTTRPHPVKVFHEGGEAYLFPLTQDEPSETFFLDDKLSNESLSMLLKACREVLGDSISGDDDLEIDFHDLGLRTSEDSSHASQVTLSQVLDVYLRLKRNEGDNNPPPLYVSLQNVPHFSGRFFAVSKAAEGGKCLANLAWWQESFNLDPEEHLPLHSAEQTQMHHFSQQLGDEEFLEAEETGEHPDPNNGQIFPDEGNKPPVRDTGSSHEFDDENDLPDESETSDEDSDSQANGTPGSRVQHIDHASNNQLGTPEESITNKVESTGILSIQDSGNGNTNEYIADNENDIHTEHDFLDELVHGHEDHQGEPYDFGGDEYGDNTEQPLILLHDDANESTDNHGQPPVEKGNGQIRDRVSSSPTLSNEDKFSNVGENLDLGVEQRDDGDDLSREGHDLKIRRWSSQSEDEKFDLLASGKDGAPQQLTDASETASAPTGPTSSDNATPPIVTSAHINGSSHNTPAEQVFDDSDEINYDEDDLSNASDYLKATPNKNSLQGFENPRTTKRNRADDEEDRIEYTTPDPKRRRS